MLRKVTHCTGSDLANTRPHQLHCGVTGRWGLLTYEQNTVGMQTCLERFSHCMHTVRFIQL